MNEQAHMGHLWGFSPPLLVLEVEAILIRNDDWCKFCLFNCSMVLVVQLDVFSRFFFNFLSSCAFHGSAGLTEGKFSNV